VPDPAFIGEPKEDILLNPQLLNKYIYCVNNPYKYIDPDGRFILAVEYNRSAQYGSLALVWNGWLPDGVYRMKTRAAIKNTNAAVKSGVYKYDFGTHKGEYFAEHPALIVNNNKAIPTDEPNPAQGNKYFADGIHIHAGNPASDRKWGTGSAGCWTVPTVQSPVSKGYSKDDPQTWSYYNDFISNFKEHPSGTAMIIRPGELINDLKNLLK
jgi:hypothetical protein